jgi:hypothetical protein
MFRSALGADMRSVDSLDPVGSGRRTARIVSRPACHPPQRRRTFSAGNRKTSVKKKRRYRKKCCSLRNSEPRNRGSHRSNGDAGQDQAHGQRPAADRGNCDPDDGRRSGDVSGDGEDPQREVVEVLLRVRDLVARHGHRQRFRDRSAYDQPDIDQDDWNHPAVPAQEQRARAEQRRGEQAAEEVVEPECGIAPPCGRSPDQCGGRKGESRERRATQQLRRARARQRPASLARRRSSAAANASSASMPAGSDER